MYSLIIQTGTNWTSWGNYLVGGVSQGVLILICLFWVDESRCDVCDEVKDGEEYAEEVDLMSDETINHERDRLMK